MDKLLLLGCFDLLFLCFASCAVTGTFGQFFLFCSFFVFFGTLEHKVRSQAGEQIFRFCNSFQRQGEGREGRIPLRKCHFLGTKTSPIPSIWCSPEGLISRLLPFSVTLLSERQFLLDLKTAVSLVPALHQHLQYGFSGLLSPPAPLYLLLLGSLPLPGHHKQVNGKAKQRFKCGNFLQCFTCRTGNST